MGFRWDLPLGERKRAGILSSNRCRLARLGSNTVCRIWSLVQVSSKSFSPRHPQSISQVPPSLIPTSSSALSPTMPGQDLLRNPSPIFARPPCCNAAQAIQYFEGTRDAVRIAWIFRPYEVDVVGSMTDFSSVDEVHVPLILDDCDCHPRHVLAIILNPSLFIF